jgi:hypothetical protein
VKLVEPETAPLGKSAKKMFDPKLSLAAMGAGKAIFKFPKNRHVLGARRRRGHGILNKNKVNLTVLSDKGRRPLSRFWSAGSSRGPTRQMGERSCLAPRRNGSLAGSFYKRLLPPGMPSAARGMPAIYGMGRALFNGNLHAESTHQRLRAQILRRGPPAGRIGTAGCPPGKESPAKMTPQREKK